MPGWLEVSPEAMGARNIEIEWPWGGCVGIGHTELSTSAASGSRTASGYLSKIFVACSSLPDAEQQLSGVSGAQMFSNFIATKCARSYLSTYRRSCRELVQEATRPTRVPNCSQRNSVTIWGKFCIAPWVRRVNTGSHSVAERREQTVRSDVIAE